MGYTAITDAEIAVGQPVQNPTWVKVQGNEAYFNTQIASFISAIQNPEPVTFLLKGEWWTQSLTYTGAAYKRVWANLTLTAGRIFIPKAGTAGTSQIDILYKRGGGSFTSIFSTKPSSAYTDGDNFVSSNGVLSTTALLTGDILRLDVTSYQTGSQESHILLPYTFT